MTYEYKYRGIYGYNYCMKTLQDLSVIENHPYKDIIQKRLEVVEFFKKHGLEPTIDAYEVSRATIYRWKAKLDGKGKLKSLSPKSTKPHKYRKSRILQDSFYVETVFDIRSEHPGIGKDKIKVLLDSECRLEKRHTISQSCIQSIINMLKRQGRISNDIKLCVRGGTEKLYEAKRKDKKRKNRRGAFNPKNPGELIQLDCVIKIINGVRRYIISAIDYKSAFSFSFAYKSLSSNSAKNFFKMFEYVAPFKIQKVQTDNGAEFLKHFDDYLKNMGITHFYTYVRHPQQNGKIERYNRTIQEEFADYNLDLLAYDIDEYNKKMVDYLLFYNLDRPHFSLGQIPPMKYIVGKLKKDMCESQMLATHTRICGYF
jgi:transposase InsO family protein